MSAALHATPPRILLLGADGQVGWELRRALLPLGEVRPLNRTQADLGDLDALRIVLQREQPDLIVNATAYTAVDKAETDPELAHGINAAAPGLLAAWTAEQQLDACGQQVLDEIIRRRIISSENCSNKNGKS
jgi:dTDP-4-dehydrorhamnose reductase